VTWAGILLASPLAPSVFSNQRYGCDNFVGDPYGGNSEGTDNRIHTQLGAFHGFKCHVYAPTPVVTFAFFSLYIVLTAWVIMSLFIGVISMGMFDAFENMKNEDRRYQYLTRLENNQIATKEEGGERKKLIKGDKLSLKPYMTILTLCRPNAD